MAGLCWLSDEAWAAIEPHLPKNQPGARRVNARARHAPTATASRDTPGTSITVGIAPIVTLRTVVNALED